MDAAATIRNALTQVTNLRAQAAATPQVARALARVKQVQARRFAGSYADLLGSSEYGPASQFFLHELYGEADYHERDAQFSRIAGSMAAVLPAATLDTVLTLAQLHALTESLDHALAQQWIASATRLDDVAGYVLAWRALGHRAQRQEQLDSALQIGQQMVVLTRKSGLATLLKLMRRPAAGAGLASLHQFLETGYLRFAALSRTKGHAEHFLGVIAARESAWLEAMFDVPRQTQMRALEQLLAIPALILP